MEREPTVREIQRRPYNRMTEAMAEIALELNRARALVQSLERQYSWMEREFAQTQVYAPIIADPPQWSEEHNEDCGDGCNYPFTPSD